MSTLRVASPSIYVAFAVIFFTMLKIQLKIHFIFDLFIYFIFYVFIYLFFFYSSWLSFGFFSTVLISLVSLRKEEG